jgi:hypothetical protein
MRKSPEPGDRWIDLTTEEYYEILATPKLLFDPENLVVIAESTIPIDRPIICKLVDDSLDRDEYLMLTGDRLVPIPELTPEIVHRWEVEQGTHVFVLTMAEFMGVGAEGMRFFLIGDRAEVEKHNLLEARFSSNKSEIEESFRRGWKEIASGEAIPLSSFWKELH